MTIEERIEERSFIATGKSVGHRIIGYETAIQIAKEYAEEQKNITLIDSARILLNEIRISCDNFKNKDIPIPQHLWSALRFSTDLVSSLEKYLGLNYQALATEEE